MAIDFEPIMDKDCNPQDALLCPSVTYAVPKEALNANRQYQGIPTIERTSNGRLFFACYTGGSEEGIGNFVILFKNDDDGKTEEEPFMLVLPSNMKTTRVYDPCLWMAPNGQLWLFVAQSYAYYDGRMGVWASVCKNPNADTPIFSPMRRIANGIMMNKPIVHNGNWLLPCAIWDKFKTEYNNIPEEKYSNVYISRDEGNTFSLLSHTDYPDRHVDEHMMAGLNDGRIMMLIRGKHGIGVAYSSDGAKTWTEAEDSFLGGPCSRFHLRRLSNGHLLLVNHYNFTKRNNLTAMISVDDGKTWTGHLLLDERQDVSYPDGIEAKDGFIYIIYDRERYDAKELLMAKITEEDILAGQLVNPESRLKNVLVHAAGVNNEENKGGRK